MAWLRLDDNAPHHRKVLEVGDVAAWLWVCGLCYCQRHSTDGHIPRKALPILGCTAWKAAAPKLVAAGLWHETPGGFEVHDFLEYQESAEVRAKRADERNARVTRYRDRQKRAAEARGNGDGNAPPIPRPSPTPTPTPRPSPAESAGDAHAAPRPPRMPQGRPGLLEGPGRWGVTHAGHVEGFCDFVCLPRKKFAEFVTRAVAGGVPDVEAEAQVLSWAQAYRQGFQGIPGDDIWTFWSNAWTATHGSNKPAAKGRGHANGLDALIAQGHP